MTRYIGFTGKPEAGKSSAADHLARRYGLARINVGDPIKEMLRGFYRCCGLIESEIERRITGDLKELPDYWLNGKTPRYAMQTLGKEWRDLISPTLFADRWRDRAQSAGGVAADGMRYADEEGPMRELGGLIVHIVRTDRPSPDNGHVAEQLQLKPDLTLYNDGTEKFFRDLDYVLSPALTGETD